jgi:hypothetical protein
MSTCRHYLRPPEPPRISILSITGQKLRQNWLLGKENSGPSRENSFIMRSATGGSYAPSLTPPGSPPVLPQVLGLKRLAKYGK